MIIERCDYCKKEEKPFANDFTTVKIHFDSRIDLTEAGIERPPKPVASYCSSCFSLFINNLREFNKGPKP